MFAPDHSPWVEIGQRIGVDALGVVLSRLGGEKVHVPTEDNFWACLERAVRDEEIRQRFRGWNMKELAAEYGVDTRHVRRILFGRRDR
ncbi:Mor transcription activator family protein [Thioalbus denitrificans]|uniref:Mor transcription activator family protein n=1 Tax=Thioalbus denitrificans TaxID=547122 RepID=UPI0014759328|nr:Mor transcription activator family protein [Thioalbus denitrificans]